METSNLVRRLRRGTLCLVLRRHPLHDRRAALREVAGGFSADGLCFGASDRCFKRSARFFVCFDVEWNGSGAHAAPVECLPADLKKTMAWSTSLNGSKTEPVGPLHFEEASGTFGRGTDSTDSFPHRPPTVQDAGAYFLSEGLRICSLFGVEVEAGGDGSCSASFGDATR